MIPPGRSWRQDNVDAAKKQQALLLQKYGNAVKIDFGTVSTGLILVGDKQVDWSSKKKRFEVFQFLSRRRTATVDEISKEVYAMPLFGKSEQYIMSARNNVNKTLSRMRTELTEAFGGEWLVCVNPKLHEFTLEPTRMIEGKPPVAPDLTPPTEAAPEPDDRVEERTDDRPPPGLSTKHLLIFERVVSALEVAAAKGEKLTIKAALDDLNLKMNEWSYALLRVRALKLTDMVERYEEVVKKAATKYHPGAAALLREQARDRFEGAPITQEEAIKNAAESVAAPEENPVKCHLPPGPMPKAPSWVKEVEFKAPIGPGTRMEIPIDSETAALMHVITTLKGHSKEVRDRVLAAASVFLGVD